MVSVCYLIVCVNLLDNFYRAETYSRNKFSRIYNPILYNEKRDQEEEQKAFLESLPAENQDECLAKTCTPYWNLPYEEQLYKKQNKCSAFVDMIGKRVEKFNNRMTCKLLQIVPSPVTKAYRNKDEFNIRYGADGNPKTVGLIVGKRTSVRRFSVNPTTLVTIRESHKRVAKVYEDFIRLSPLPATHKTGDGGYWRTLIVRSNEAGEVMASVTVQPKGYTMKTIMKQQRAMKEYFIKHLPNITLFQQQCPFKRCTHRDAPFNLLYGKPYFMETLNGYKFKISPDTPFQINKLAAEMFYDTIIKTAKLKPNTTVLDIFSGTGTIAILMSKLVERAFGIESNPNSVVEATYTAHLNNIHNLKFLLGRAEKKLKQLLKKLKKISNDVVAIVNPTYVRPGFIAMTAIRRSSVVSRLLYISCKPESPTDIQNFILLSNNRSMKYPPFRLTKAIPVDLYPQTPRVELILMFEK